MSSTQITSNCSAHKTFFSSNNVSKFVNALENLDLSDIYAGDDVDSA